MNVQEEITRRFETEVVVVCDRIFTEGVRQMEKAMESAGLVVTGELKRSLYSERAYISGELEVQFRMGMLGYGRFKDMKKLRHAKFPDPDALEEFTTWIEKIGVDKFINNERVMVDNKSIQLFVPGYPINSRRKAKITVERATTRLTYAFARYKRDLDTVKRSNNPFYNVNKGDIYADIIDYLMKKLPTDFMQALKEYYERPFYEKEGYHD